MGIRRRTVLRFPLALGGLWMGCGCRPESQTAAAVSGPASYPALDLPPPAQTGNRSLEEVVASRRSKRAFSEQSLTTGQLSQLLWAAQGVTSPLGFRAAPSAGALYPLELYVISVEGLFHYRSDRHSLAVLSEADMREEVWQAGLEQAALRDAPAVFLLAAVFGRTEARYGEKAERYVFMEAGHAAQNLLLQAVALGLGGVPIGAFYEEALRDDLGLPEEHIPVYLIPVGHPIE
jgi:SagB-type dehydrogenase family enzyme